MRGGMENRVKCSFKHVDQSHPDPNDPNHNPDPVPNHEPLPGLVGQSTGLNLLCVI